jgi:16S rRNA (cytosine967-C5)-methyltransferase
VVARNSDLRWSKTEDDSAKLADLQARMIRHAADLVKPGGVMVYSTCTTIRRENEQVIESFLQDRRGFSVERADKFLPREIVTEVGFVKTYPDHIELDGAFCVRLKKNLGSKPG